MKACRLGSAKNCWKCSALSHSSWTRTKPSPIPKLDRAGRSGGFGDLRELVAAVGQSLTELNGVALKFGDD
jgi:hypothetical protein